VNVKGFLEKPMGEKTLVDMLRSLLEPYQSGEKREGRQK